MLQATEKPLTDWKKALKKLADAIDEQTDCNTEFCYRCPAASVCALDNNNNANRCRRVINRWARENF